jgi:predicted ester cyclase
MSDLQTTIERLFALTDALAWEDRAQLMTEDVDFVTPNGPATGRQASIDFSIPMGVAFPTMQHVVDKLVVAGDDAIVEGRWHATNTGPLTTAAGTIDATGRTVDLPWCAVFHRDGELLDAVHIYFDQMVMLGQLGLVPEPTTAAAAG